MLASWILNHKAPSGTVADSKMAFIPIRLFMLTQKIILAENTPCCSSWIWICPKTTGAYRGKCNESTKLIPQCVGRTGSWFEPSQCPNTCASISFLDS